MQIWAWIVGGFWSDSIAASYTNTQNEKHLEFFYVFHKISATTFMPWNMSTHWRGTWTVGQCVFKCFDMQFVGCIMFVIDANKTPNSRNTQRVLEKQQQRRWQQRKQPATPTNLIHLNWRGLKLRPFRHCAADESHPNELFRTKRIWMKMERFQSSSASPASPLGRCRRPAKRDIPSSQVITGSQQSHNPGYKNMQSAQYRNTEN